MKNFLSMLTKLFGCLMIAFGCISILIGIAVVFAPPAEVGVDIFAIVLFAGIAFLLIYGGRRLIVRARDAQYETLVDLQDRQFRLPDLDDEMPNMKRKQRFSKAVPSTMNESVFLTEQQIERLEQQIELPNLDNCELVLRHGEFAVYGSRAIWHTDVIDEANRGHLYITNQRIAFVADEKRFILHHSDVIAVVLKTNGFILQDDQNWYSLEMPRVDLANMALKGLRKGLPIAGVDNREPLAAVEYTGVIDSVAKVDGMEGHVFEHFCAEILEKNGFTNVEVTKGSGDQGVDILAVKGGIKYAIQCKNYASKLGNTPIQEVNAGKTFYKCHVGVVMTNSTFTPAAEELANSTNVLLWDRDVLDRYIKQTL